MQAVHLHRTTVHRLLKCLLQEGALAFDIEGSKYHLGPFILDSGLWARRQIHFNEALSPVLAHIVEATGDTVFLILRDGNDSICIDRRLGAYPVKALVVEVGTRRPLGVGVASIAMMQGLDKPELKRILEENARSLAAFGTTAAAVLKDVRTAAKMGYVSGPVPGVDGVTAIALPILDPQGRPVAAIAVAAIHQRMSSVRQRQLAETIRSEIAHAQRLLREKGPVHRN